MEPTTGIEPVNLFLTKEALYLLSYVGLIGICLFAFKNFDGAGDESRTRDIQLGRLTLCQLSYSRTRKTTNTPHRKNLLPDTDHPQAGKAGTYV